MQIYEIQLNKTNVIKKSGCPDGQPDIYVVWDLLCVLHLVNNSLESGGIVESEVGKHLAVDLDT